MAKAFICAAPEGHPGVRQLIEQLQARHYQPSIHGASPVDRQSWERAMRDIADADVFIPVITPAALQSPSCTRQFDWAERLAKPVLPVLAEAPTTALPPRFLAHRMVDYSHSAPPDQSSAALDAALASLRPPPPLPFPLPRPPRAPRSAGGLRRAGVFAAATLASVMVVSLVIWLCVDTWVSRASRIKVIPSADGVFVGSARAGTTIDVFTEPICDPCARLARASDGDIRKALHDKKIAVRYHLLSELDNRSTSGDYSTRAVAASICVAESGDPDRYLGFYAALFAPDFQPKQKADASTDRSNADLARLAEKTGAPPTVGSCIADGQRIHTAQTQATNARDALKRLSGMGLVPMIYLGTREVDYDGAGWIDNLR